MGYKSRVDSSMFGANQKMVEDEVARKKKEYQNNTELTQISKLYEAQKVTKDHKLVAKFPFCGTKSSYACLIVLFP